MASNKFGRKILLTGPRNFKIKKCPRPQPGAGEALIRIHKVGVCGSDMQIFREGEIGGVELGEPRVIGHECMGEVVSAGDSVDENLVGQRVAVEPSIPCGQCRWCTIGMENVCPEGIFLGLPPKNGALCDYLIHPADRMELLPDNISDAAGVMLEPLAIALHAVNLADVGVDDRVVILGTGVIGTCVLEILQLYRGLEVICVDLQEDRLERARQMGAASVIQPANPDDMEVGQEIKAAVGGYGADVVFECSGSSAMLWNMCEVAGPGGHVAIVGSNPDDRVLFASSSARRKGLTIRYVRRSLHTLKPCIRLVSEGEINADDKVTHEFSCKDIEQAFDIVDGYKDGVLKALVDFQ